MRIQPENGVGRVTKLGLLAMVLPIALAIGIAPPMVAQERERDTEPSTANARPGGIPRRALGAEQARDVQEGTEEGVPDAAAAPRLKELVPRIAPPRGDWKLGVWVYNTEAGVVITRVQRGSAAERRGLERGDRIVSVEGYQVGYVGDYLYPLGYELQRQVDRRGNVLLLVQNVRNGELTSFRVRLDSNEFHPLPEGEPRRDRFTPPPPSAPDQPDR